MLAHPKPFGTSPIDYPEPGGPLGAAQELMSCAVVYLAVGIAATFVSPGDFYGSHWI